MTEIRKFFYMLIHVFFLFIVRKYGSECISDTDCNVLYPMYINRRLRCIQGICHTTTARRR
ncbi:putative Late nodulin [Medicago truncatula]|uniref:Nodule Cysteine-Rich (NCR) secreted peptide n=1 Tax=Medicago truncatula TaxID=3880 RepID=G7LDP2_MEDTR|nr:Nodule Cysteine-Rich (NCR) secreted peptide [Medicago truncatula]RHN40187.1 putative Late nodulin [Medicago truncatula]